ncbi:hypothetical protein [Streptomyces sp. NPDC006309]|uniref:hypothetical protein n=1 Tax=Streptomyces sp. NPDC006309 TaxID=3156749 RepID=UPI0033BCDC1E
MQRADLVVRVPAAGVPVMLLEIDRRTEDADDLVHKLRPYGEWGRLLAPGADKHTADLVRSRPDAIASIDHEQRLWRRVYPPTGREGLVPVAFVFADTTEAKVANTVAVLEEAGRRYWAPRRYDTLYRRRSPRGTIARRCPSSSPPWSSSRSTAPVRRCGGGWDGPGSRH